VNLTLPERFEARLSPQSTALHLAIGLFVAEEATLGQAAEVAGLTQSDFLRELGRRRIPIHNGANELKEDAVEALLPGPTAEAQRWPDPPWLEESVPAPFDLPPSHRAERVQARQVSERLPDPFHWIDEAGA
jgi:predicted HTH domain antitoxin